MSSGLPLDDLEERVSTRMGRQELLTHDNAPRMWFVLDEAVLHRPVGGRPSIAIRDPKDPDAWRKSSRSQGAGAECVEVAQAPGLVGIRDSKDPDGPRLMVGAGTAKVVFDAIKAGRHDL